MLFVLSMKSLGRFGSSSVQMGTSWNIEQSRLRRAFPAFQVVFLTTLKPHLWQQNQIPVLYIALPGSLNGRTYVM